MKLFTNKQFQRVLEKELQPLKEENIILKDTISKKEYKYLSENQRLNVILQQYEETIEILESKLGKLELKYKKVFGARGGLTKYVHRLEKELAEANEKLSQRYIIKELKPSKPRKTQTMKVKSTAKTSKIIKKVVEDE